MPKTNGSGRNQRNNPYQLEELFVKFHRTPAGIAWRWRTELTTLTSPWPPRAGGSTPGPPSPGQPSSWPGSWPWSFAVPHSRRFITRRAWCVLARHRLQRLCYEARLHTRSGRLPLILWTRPTKVGERTWVLCRAGICAEDFEAHIGELQGRLLRPRRAGHPQPPLVPPDHHRHHPPRHPRGQRAHQPPRWSGSPRTTTSASSNWSPPWTLPPTRASPPHNPARRSPATPGAACPTRRRHHDCHRHPAAAAGPHLPVLHVRPGAPGPRRIRRARPRQPGRTQHAARRRTRRGQILRAEPDHRARRAVP